MVQQTGILVETRRMALKPPWLTLFLTLFIMDVDDLVAVKHTC